MALSIGIKNSKIASMRLLISIKIKLSKYTIPENFILGLPNYDKVFLDLRN